ncbi:hypothetical protein [Phenylobacterium ferrooxidans]|uniref:DUF4365 domain-containing protein n=1 Tax=Phenylobacterium ferrooxidans TaxID=2982689 RepID=A0ABW6CKW1_9CAUL
MADLALHPADIGAIEPRLVRQLLLRPPALTPHALHILSEAPADIHARHRAPMMTIVLRTMSLISLDLMAGQSEPRVMFDLSSPKHSVLLEKTLEHIFLVELSKILLLQVGCSFEVLRSEFDSEGYDLVVDAREVIRHIQLKGMMRGGARSSVNINLGLGRKASGCVVWMVANPQTLEIGPFYWFGGAPGAPLPPLGDKIARHSKANTQGIKTLRQDLREVSKGRFERVETMERLVQRLFGATAPRVALEILRAHLAERRGGGDAAHSAWWLDQAAKGDFSSIPDDLRWDTSAEFAHLIDGYRLLGVEGPPEARSHMESMRKRRALDGRWIGTVSDLWIMLFLEHRRFRFEGRDPSPAEVADLDRLCRDLREGAIALGA